MSDVITLTEGQQSAYEAFVKFITQPSEGVFVIEGFSGTGKSTLIETVMDNLDNVLKTAKLMVPKTYIHRDVVLTATTNQPQTSFHVSPVKKLKPSNQCCSYGYTRI